MPHIPGHIRHIREFDPEEEAAQTSQSTSANLSQESDKSIQARITALAAPSQRVRQGVLGDPESELGTFGLPNQTRVSPSIVSSPGEQASVAAGTFGKGAGGAGTTSTIDTTPLMSRARLGQLTPEDQNSILQQIASLSAQAVEIEPGIFSIPPGIQAQIDNLKLIYDLNREQALAIGRGPEGGMSEKLKTGLEQLMALNREITQGGGTGTGNRVLSQSVAESGFLANQRATQAQEAESAERERFFGFTSAELNSLPPNVVNNIINQQMQQQQQQQQMQGLVPLLSQLLPGIDPQVLSGVPMDFIPTLLTLLKGGQLQGFGGGLNFASTGR